MKRKVRIGTRGSALARIQAEMIHRSIAALPLGLDPEIVPLVSTGDRKQGTVAAAHGDKKDWIAGIEEELLADRIDCAVHSAKDVPLNIAEGTALQPVLGREIANDVIILRPPYRTLGDLPGGALLGTASVRRRAQLLRIRPDLEIVPVRGNVPTRVAALESRSELAGLVLAAAGLERLHINSGSTGMNHDVLPFELMVPAVHQGTLIAQFCLERDDIKTLLSRLSDPKTECAWLAERACLEILGADCSSAVGIFSSPQSPAGEPRLSLLVRVLSQDGQKSLEVSDTGRLIPSEAVNLGRTVGDRLMKMGAGDLLRGIP